MWLVLWSFLTGLLLLVYLDLASLSWTLVMAPHAICDTDNGVDRRGKNGESEKWLRPRRGVLEKATFLLSLFFYSPLFFILYFSIRGKRTTDQLLQLCVQRWRFTMRYNCPSWSRSTRRNTTPWFTWWDTSGPALFYTGFLIKGIFSISGRIYCKKVCVLNVGTQWPITKVNLPTELQLGWNKYVAAFAKPLKLKQQLTE